MYPRKLIVHQQVENQLRIALSQKRSSNILLLRHRGSGGGLIAVVNGGLNLAIAKGGPGTGNGVVGGALALVLGLIAMVLGWLALARSRRTSQEGR
jgi:hypothetical protein